MAACARPCQQCGCEFTPSRKRHEARFCSKRCIWLAVKGPEYNAMISRASAVARGDAQRGRGEGKFYRKMNGRHEHRVVAEIEIGRPLTSNDIVHHRDHVRSHNAPSNLEVMTRAEHIAEHKPWEARKNV